ncbi:MAG: SOS response-associated peptidase [Acidiferrobacterales bacterium]
MCGRFMLATPREHLVSQFRLRHAPELGPRYNIAPSQPVAIVRETIQHGRQLALVHWGLIPYWVKEPNDNAKMINARAETLTERPFFRSAFAQRRCLVPADGFYEWKKVTGKKQPYSIRTKNEKPIAFAGLWERWRDRSRVIESCAIITTDANELIQSLHDRMPVILDEQDYARWLDCSLDDPVALQPLLRPYDPHKLVAYAVSTRVNSPKNDDIDCIAPVEPS